MIEIILLLVSFVFLKLSLSIALLKCLLVARTRSVVAGRGLSCGKAM